MFVSLYPQMACLEGIPPSIMMTIAQLQGILLAS